MESDGSPSNLPARSVTHHHSIMYAPKCLVLVSRLDYIETFRVSIDREETLFKLVCEFRLNNTYFFYYRIVLASSTQFI